MEDKGKEVERMMMFGAGRPACAGGLRQECAQAGGRGTAERPWRKRAGPRSQGSNNVTL